jgi:NitT/TauT family transport system substrate-binding protein
MANVSLDALLALVRQGQPGFRAISAPAKPIPYVMIARNAITSLNDLTGKTFGVGQAGTLDATLSEHLLAAHGMGSSVNMVGIGPPIARVKALAAGRIDATAVSIGTWSTDPYKEGFHVLADRGEFDRIAPRVAKVNVVSLDTLQKSRGELVKVTAALMALSRDFSRHPETWSDAMAAAKSRASRGQLQQLADVYRKDWCIDDCLDPDSLRSSIRMLQAVPPSSGTIADFSIVAEAKRLLARASHWPSNGSAIAKSP